MRMDIKKSEIEGCFELMPFVASDDRGCFVKTFQFSSFVALGLETKFTEEYYSISKKNVLRGMHFQRPPHDHVKVVYCVEGEVLDVVVDLRKSSTTYGKTNRVILSKEKTNLIYIPKGCAHGFLVLSESATLMYKVTSEYNAEADSGLLWNSFNISWPIKEPILSQRDTSFRSFASFESPF